MICVKNLSKKFTQDAGIFELNFEIAKNTLSLLIAPNGAGKTTCLKVLASLLKPDEGSVLIDGVDLFDNIKTFRASIGYLPETVPCYKNYTVYEYLSFLAAIRCLDKPKADFAIEKSLEMFQIGKYKNSVCGTLSKGSLQRLGLAQATLHNPKLILLDEPGSGLDPEQQQNLVKSLNELKKESTIILSTHYASNFTFVSDRVITMRAGRVINETGASEFAKQADASYGVVSDFQQAGNI